MTTQTRTRTFIAPHATRRAAAARAMRRLPEVVYRTTRLEGERITHAEAAAAVTRARAR